MNLEKIKELLEESKIREIKDIEVIEKNYMRFSGPLGVYVIRTMDDDEFYIRFMFPNFWPIESNNEMAKAIVTSNYVTNKKKAVKTFVENNNVSSSFEGFFYNEDGFILFFELIIKIINSSTKFFAALMHDKISLDENSKKILSRINNEQT